MVRGGDLKNFMKELYFAYPGDLDTPTGGYGYDRRIISGLRTNGWDVETVCLGNGFPFPSLETLENAQSQIRRIPEGSVVVVDGLAFGAMSEIAKDYEQKLQLIALLHHPLCQENGLQAEQSGALHASERVALRCARQVIVTSPATAGQVTQLFDVPESNIDVIVPGTDVPDPFDRTSSNTVRLLSVGTVVPRKGYDLLFEALAGIPDQNWSLDIVGGTNADPDCYMKLLALAGDLKLAEQIMFHGSVPGDALAGFYQAADVFVLASRYEGYGMAYTEAMAHGLPVIGSGSGAVEETLSGGAAIYCGEEDIASLQDALTLLISNPRQRAGLAEKARAVAQNLPSWQAAVLAFEEVLLGYSS